MKRFVAWIVIVCALFMGGRADAETLKAGYVSKDLNYLPFFIAQKKGFYAKEGIQVDLVSIGRADVQLKRWSPASSTSPISTRITLSFGTNEPTAT
jgi:ABC-type nitrate/sulfonate/bicarbonate transport system substrate-binding protein